MIRLVLLLCLLFMKPSPAEIQTNPSNQSRSPETSEYFAFVDRDYIFTIEVVRPGVILFNFVSMTDKDISLPAKNLRLTLANRKIPAKLFAIDTANPKEPMLLPSLTMHPRSSFGVRVEGDFGDVEKLYGVSIRVGNEDFKLDALDSFDFESLVLKVNRLNLDSPDFSEDWHVLKMERIGRRVPAGRR